MTNIKRLLEENYLIAKIASQTEKRGKKLEKTNSRHFLDEMFYNFGNCFVQTWMRPNNVHCTAYNTSTHDCFSMRFPVVSFKRARYMFKPELCTRINYENSVNDIFKLIEIRDLPKCYKNFSTLICDIHYPSI